MARSSTARYWSWFFRRPRFQRNSFLRKCPVASGLAPSPATQPCPGRMTHQRAPQNPSDRNPLYRKAFNSNYTFWTGTQHWMGRGAVRARGRHIRAAQHVPWKVMRCPIGIVILPTRVYVEVVSAASLRACIVPDIACFRHRRDRVPAPVVDRRPLLHEPRRDWIPNRGVVGQRIGKRQPDARLADYGYFEVHVQVGVIYGVEWAATEAAEGRQARSGLGEHRGGKSSKHESEGCCFPVHRRFPLYWIWKSPGGRPGLMTTLLTVISRSRLPCRNWRTWKGVWMPPAVW